MSKLHSALIHLVDTISRVAGRGAPALQLTMVVVFAAVLSGCDLAGDILEFGFWTGVIIVVIIVVIIMAIRRFFRRRL